MTAQERNAHKRLAKVLTCRIYELLSAPEKDEPELSGNTLELLCNRMLEKMRTDAPVTTKQLSAMLNEGRDVISSVLVKLLSQKKIINIAKKGNPGLYVKAVSSIEM